MRKAIVKYDEIDCGIIRETEDGTYIFQYNENYTQQFPEQFVCFDMPVGTETYKSQRLFPFFDGLIPEGWLLNITVESWKINRNDRFGLLLAIGKDCIGAVSVHEIKEKYHGE